MGDSDKEQGKNKEVNDQNAFPNTLSIETLYATINPSTQNLVTSAKEKLITNAFKAHSAGNIQEAITYYQYFLKKGFSFTT